MPSRVTAGLALVLVAATGTDGFSPSTLPSHISAARLRISASDAIPAPRRILNPLRPKSLGASLRMSIRDSSREAGAQGVVGGAIEALQTRAVAATLALTILLSGAVVAPQDAAAQNAAAPPQPTTGQASSSGEAVAQTATQTASDADIILKQRKVAKLDPSVQDKVQVFAEILSGINNAYVDTPDLDKISEIGFNAMLNSLDPYTEFENPKATNQMRTLTTGNYGGVGLAIQKLTDPNDKEEPYVYVMNAFEGFAWDAGLRPGDKLIKVDGQDIATKPVSDVSEMLKGPRDTQVKVTVERAGVSGPIEKTLNRRQIPLRDVPIAMTIDEKNEVGYAKLSGFSSSAPFELRYVINKIQEQNQMKSFILDMRGNTGGLLSSAVQIADIFLPENVPVVSTKGRPSNPNQAVNTDEAALAGLRPEKQDTMYKSVLIPRFTGRAPDGTPIFSDKPLLQPNVKVVVLVDKSTASAAEIVAGAIQDHDRGVVMGQTTYGKGLVQVLQRLSGGRQLKYTSAKYYTPSGRCIQSKSYKNEGKAGTTASGIEDKDRTVFYTDNGRPVKDGGGIEPDVKLEKKQQGQLLAQLDRWNAFYRFAGELVPEIKDGEKRAMEDEAIVTDAMYDRFQKYAMDKMGDQVLSSAGPFSRSLDLFTEALTDGGFKEAVADVKALQKHLGELMVREFVTSKPELKNKLEESVRRRFVVDPQVLSWQVAVDDSIKEAVKYAEDEKLYTDVINARPLAVTGSQVAVSGVAEQSQVVSSSAATSSEAEGVQMEDAVLETET